nr:MAG TPA: hypothetical protein [Crassvirales sp.]
MWYYRVFWRLYRQKFGGRIFPTFQRDLRSHFGNTSRRE